MMKKIKSFTLLMLLICLAGCILSCNKNEAFNARISTDPAKPAVVSNIKVDDYNGGSFITYTLPKSDNVLYVLARYEIRAGVSRETKSSYYTDTINVEGFAKAQEYSVTLYTVSRSEVMSDPLTVKVHPKTPVYQLVRASLALDQDFGGVHIGGRDVFKKEVGVILTGYDQSTRTQEIQDQHYTKVDTIDYSLRGYAAVARDFGVYVTDKFGNISDTLKKNITPLFEQLLDKSQFSAYNLNSDTPIGYGWVLPNLWDGKTDNGSAGWHTNPGNTPPFVCTFNVGKTYKLSRFILWERPEQFAFNHGNPKIFSLWGSNVAAPKDAQLPLSAAVGAVVGDWINLANYRYPDPPSGKPVGSTTSADNAFVLAGVNFNVPLTAPNVHFLRLSVTQTWSGGDFAHAMEISIYGKAQ